MDSFSLYKDHIGQTLTQRLADAIGGEIVTLDEGSEIAKEILSRVNGAKNHDELISFMEELAQKWTLFGPVLVAEQSAQIGEEVAQSEEKAVAEVENLLKENKIDEALATAEQANQDSQNNSESLPRPQDDSKEQLLPSVPVANTETPAPDLTNQQPKEQPTVKETSQPIAELPQEVTPQTDSISDPNGTGGTP